MADTTTKILEVVVDNNQALSAIADYNKLIDEQKQKQKELADDFKAGKMSQEDYYKAMAKSKEETKAYSRQMQELSKEVQNNIKQEQEHDGSLRGLRAALSNATKEYDALSRAERQGAKGKELQDHINQITTELKEAEEETQRFYRNVGNYPDVKPLETQLGELRKQLAQLKYEGKENTEEFQNLLGIASNMKDAIADVEGAISGAASDTAKLDSLTQSTGTLLQLWAQYSIISQKLGVENKDLESTFQALSVIMGVLTAAQSVQNMLQSQSAVMRGVSATQTWLLVAAEKAHATALTATGVAQKIATAAQWAFNAAASANPIGLLVAGVVAATAAVYGLVKAFKLFSGPGKDALNNFKQTGEQLDKLQAQYADHIEAVKAEGATEQEVLLQTMTLNGDLARRRAEHFEEAKKLYKKDKDEYKDALEAKKQADADYERSFKDVQNSLRAALAGVNAQAREEAFGTTEIAIENAKRSYNAQVAMINELFAVQKISAMEKARLMLEAESSMNYLINKARKDAAKSAAQEWAQRKKTEQDEMRRAFDLELELIIDQTAKEKAIAKENHRRTIEDLKTRLSTEKNLTKDAKDALQRQILLQEELYRRASEKASAQEIKEQIENEAEALKLKLAIVKEDSDEEYRLKKELLEKQLMLELKNDELTQEQRLLLREKYNQDLEALEDEHLNNLYQKEMDMLKLEWDNKIAEAALRGENTLALEVERRKAELDALHQMEEESDAEFKARMLAAEQAYTDSKKALLDQQAANTQANMEAAAAVMGSLSQLLSAFGEENEEAAKAAKVLALGEIAINTGKAIAAGVAQAQSVPFPANIAAIATTVATVLANVATAITTVKSAKFATGGLVIGPGTGTSDSISARLSNGESVMNARSTAMFGPILSSLNQAGGGVAFNPKGGGQAEGFQYLASAVAAGMKHADLRVGVDEITDVKGRVDRIKDISTIG